MESLTSSDGLSLSFSPPISSSDLPSAPSFSPTITESRSSQPELAFIDFLGINNKRGATAGPTLGLEDLCLQDAQEGSMSGRENFHIARAKTSIEQSIGNSKGNSKTRSSQVPTLDLHEAARTGSSNNSLTQIQPTIRGSRCHGSQSNPLISNPSMRIQGHRNFGNSSICLEDYSISGSTRVTSFAYPVDVPKTETISDNPSPLVDLRDSNCRGNFPSRNSALGWEGNNFNNRQIGEITRSHYPHAPTSSVFPSFRSHNTANRLQDCDQGSQTRNFLSNSLHEERVPSSIETQGITGTPPNRIFSGAKPVDVPSPDVQWAKIILLMATNHNGSSHLHEILAAGEPTAIKRIFDGVLECLVDLMINRFGNCLLQKLITVCGDDQITELVYRLFEQGDRLILVGCHPQGTFFLQKLISIIKRSSQLVEIMMAAIAPGLLILMTNKNGSQMIDQCLLHFSNNHNQVIFKTIQEHCIDLAKDAVAYLRIQSAVKGLADPYRNVLLIKTVNEALQLAQDIYGNYIIQEVINLQILELTKAICHVLRGHYVNLSMNKYGSHVVEKCIKSPWINIVINEFISYDKLADIACDCFGNYVLQTALRTAKGNLSRRLVRAIQKHCDRLQFDKHGEKVLREWANTSALLQFQEVI